MKSADITRAVERFELFGPAKLLFTRLDETGTLGPVLNEASRTRKPISFLTAGQQVPEHLEPATTARIADLVQYQNAYQANAQMFTVLNSLTQTAVNLLQPTG